MVAFIILAYLGQGSDVCCRSPSQACRHDGLFPLYSVLVLFICPGMLHLVFTRLVGVCGLKCCSFRHPVTSGISGCFRPFEARCDRSFSLMGRINLCVQSHST